MIHLPSYRAKKLDTENEYIEGFLKNCTDTGLDVFWIQDKDFIDYRIDIDTLSINFPDMLDSQGNKIFASLQEDGKGGDIIKGQDYGQNEYVVIYNSNIFDFGILLIKEENTDYDCWEYSQLSDEYLDLLTVTGIQK